jgi:uracil-DNA glycosylase family 4
MPPPVPCRDGASPVSTVRVCDKFDKVIAAPKKARALTCHSETATETRPEMDLPSWLTQLQQEVIGCAKCPRLVEYRERIAREKRRAYLEWEYWGKPVPGFGDPHARVVILGLAPGAHGSNRTGRPFTGDSSGYFMYPVLYETGFANQANATHRGDGLMLKDAYITAAVRCAPPDNKPSPLEIANCAPYLDRELDGLSNVKVVVALGRIGFDAYLNYLKRRGLLKSKSSYVFGHGAKYQMPDGRALLASYHPSNQNTNTGKLTREMFVKIFQEAWRLARVGEGSGGALGGRRSQSTRV